MEKSAEETLHRITCIKLATLKKTGAFCQNYIYKAQKKQSLVFTNITRVRGWAVGTIFISKHKVLGLITGSTEI